MRGNSGSGQGPVMGSCFPQYAGEQWLRTGTSGGFLFSTLCGGTVAQDRDQWRVLVFHTVRGNSGSGQGPVAGSCFPHCAGEQLLRTGTSGGFLFSTLCGGT